MSKNEISRIEYLILKILKKNQCNSHFQSMTLGEIMDITKTARVTTYRKIVNLCNSGLVGKGCRCGKADTYFILENGIDIVEREERRIKYD
jgi:hypothetical protein